MQRFALAILVLFAMPSHAGVSGSASISGVTVVNAPLKTFDQFEEYDHYDAGAPGPVISVEDLGANITLHPSAWFALTSHPAYPGLGYHQEYVNVLPTYQAAYPDLRILIPDRFDVHLKQYPASQFSYSLCPGTPSPCVDYDGDLNGITGDGAGGFDSFNTDWITRVPDAHWDAIVAAHWNTHDFCTGYTPPADAFGTVVAGSTKAAVQVTGLSALAVDAYAGWTLKIGVDTEVENVEARIIASHTACNPGTCTFTFSNTDLDNVPVAGQTAEVRVHNLNGMDDELCALKTATEGPMLYGFAMRGSNALGVTGFGVDICNTDYQDWKILNTLAVITDYGIGLNEKFALNTGAKPGMWEPYYGPPGGATDACNLAVAEGEPSWQGALNPNVAGSVMCSVGGRVFYSQYAPGEFATCYSQMLEKTYDALVAAGYTDFRLVVTEDVEYVNKYQAFVNNPMKRRPFFQGHRLNYWDYVGLP